MSEWRTFRRRVARAKERRRSCSLPTFALTVLVDLTVAIQVGMVLAAFLFMQRMAEVTNVTAVTRSCASWPATSPTKRPARGRSIPDGVEIFEI